MVDATQLEGVVRAYFAACNAADAAAIAACLTPDAVQYGYAPSQPRLFTDAAGCLTGAALRVLREVR
jgi:hypothetical protein